MATSTFEHVLCFVQMAVHDTAAAVPEETYFAQAGEPVRGNLGRSGVEAVM